MVTEPPAAPSWIDQVTAVLLLPVTVAVKVALWHASTAADVGAMATTTGGGGGGGACTVTAAVASCVGSATDWASTW